MQPIQTASSSTITVICIAQTTGCHISFIACVCFSCQNEGEDTAQVEIADQEYSKM